MIWDAILLMLWFIGSMYASTKGTRFVLLLVPAFGIAVGIALGLVHRMLTKIVSEEFKIKKIIVSLALVVLLIFDHSDESCQRYSQERGS